MCDDFAIKGSRLDAEKGAVNYVKKPFKEKQVNSKSL